ncbi:MAG TPA: glycosyltransferase family A protein, partial [Acidimicrobiales bacterium]|nr:glycosyltransferase family A protein [Acidimicrobiales bacterium]
RLQRLECRILLHDHLRPQVAAAANFVFGARKYELMARSRLLLNIHREDDPYFEWHRALGALANGCVLLTETATGYEPLDPFRHFVMAEPDALADHVTALCADDTVVARLRQDSYEFARTELDFVSWLGQQLPMFEEWTDGAPTSLPASVVDRLNQEFHLAVDSWASGAVPAPVGVEDAAATGTRRMLKRQVLSQLALRRRVESLECRLEHGTDQRVSTTISPAYRRLEPDVSVVIPLYNYEETVAEAIGSVFRSREVVPEVVVVEDHSHDRSREVVERFVLDHPELPLKLVALDVNVGLPSARNLGFEEARSEKVFLLDADNAVYPRALRKLSDAVDSSGAAFSYSMIECFGDGRRLLSVFPWDVERLRRQPYIDAMSMVRKDVWKAVGGFRSDVETLYGWEDYVFWLSLAEAGHEGRLVPEILCRYRLHGRSMINVTNLDIVEVWDELRAMFGLGPLEPLKWTT